MTKGQVFRTLIHPISQFQFQWSVHRAMLLMFLSQILAWLATIMVGIGNISLHVAREDHIRACGGIGLEL